MNRKHWLFLVAGTVMLAGGCLPEKRVLWSPDGKWGAVRGADGLYLCDADGRLSSRLVPGARAMAWRPDSRGLVVAHSEKTTRWEEVDALLTPEQRARIEARGPQLRAEILAHEGEWEKFDPKSLAGLSPGEAQALLLYVRQRHSAGLPEKLGPKWDEGQDEGAELHTLRLYALSAGPALEPGAVLERSIEGLANLVVAPTGKAAAFVRPIGADERMGLFVVSLAEPGPARRVAEDVSLFPDWTADGRRLVYAATSPRAGREDGALRVGVVAQREVCAEAGELLSSFPDPQELAGTLFQGELAVRSLPDGRVLFTALEVQLPCAKEDLPERPALFAIDPGRSPVVSRVVTRSKAGALPDAQILLEPSPDGRHVCVPGEDGRVAVLTLATGVVWEVLEAQPDSLRMVPVWRGNDALCVSVNPNPAAGRERGQVVLLELNWNTQSVQQRVLSEKWPAELTADFLGAKQGGNPLGR